MKREAGTVSIVDVGKRFVKYEDAPTLVEGLTKLVRRHRRGRLWAVRHVNLEVAAGEGVGVVGRNGSGKTTLLSILAGVTAPTEGSVRVQGRLAPLLGLGVGFDNELTGRENVYINGAILGMTRAQLDRRLDDIIAFAEMEDFIDTPVKFYSSGMTVRLGFSVAISADPSLLLVDEVLAVGDVGFQRKSFERMQQLRDNGTTILVVSHNTPAIHALTSRVLVLHRGAPVFLGPTDEGLRHYLELLRVASEPYDESDPDGGGGATVQVESVEVERLDGSKAAVVNAGEEVLVRVRLRVARTLNKPVFLVEVRTETNMLIFSETWNEFADHDVHLSDESSVVVRLPVRLPGGSYRILAGVVWREGLEPRKHASAHTVLAVSGRPGVRGFVDLKPTFDVERPGPSVSAGD